MIDASGAVCTTQTGFLSLRACGASAIGECADCGRPVCKRHSSRRTGRRTEDREGRSVSMNAWLLCPQCNARSDSHRDSSSDSSSSSSSSSSSGSSATAAGIAAGGGAFAGAGAAAAWSDTGTGAPDAAAWSDTGLGAADAAGFTASTAAGVDDGSGGDAGFESS